MGLSPITGYPLFRYFKDSGGSADMIGNYSVTPKTFFIQPPVNQNFIVREIVAHFTYTGTNLVYNSYGDIVGGLTNGITVQLADSSNAQIYDLLGGETIKTNDDFIHIAQTLTEFNFASNLVSVSIKIFQFDGNSRAITIQGEVSEQLQVILNDDFSALTDHHFAAKGSIQQLGEFR